MADPIVFVEPFAGSAALSLHLLGGQGLKPLTSWMGGKRRFSRKLLYLMGLTHGCPVERLILNDLGPWGLVWQCMANPRQAEMVALILDRWHSSEVPIQALWEALKVRGPSSDPIERVAEWLVLQSRSANGTPLFWDSHLSRYSYSNGHGSYCEARQKGRNSKGWAVGKPNVAWGGLTRIATLAERVRATSEHLRPIEVEASVRPAELLRPPPNGTGYYLYLDPPYEGCTGYGWDCERFSVLAMAERWAISGAVVAISESVGLAHLLGSSWQDLNVSLRGSEKSEWVTIYTPY